MANSKRLFKEELKAYITEERLNILDTFSKEDWELFEGMNINTKDSYLVFGSSDQLYKFEAYYLGRHVYNKSFYKRYNVMEYVNWLATQNTVNAEAYSLDRDIVILYAHKNFIGIGKTELWVETTLLEKIASRNRTGGITIVLSERNLDKLQESGEMTVINLPGMINMRSIIEDISDTTTLPKESRVEGTIAPIDLEKALEETINSNTIFNSGTYNKKEGK